MKPNIPGRESNEATRMAVLWCIWRIERATRGKLGPNAAMIVGMIHALTGTRVAHSTVLHYLDVLDGALLVSKTEDPEWWVKGQWHTTEKGRDALEIYTEDVADPIEELSRRHI